MTIVPIRDVEKTMNSVAGTAQMAAENRLACDVRVEQRDCRNHRLRLVAMNDVGKNQFAEHQRIQGVKPEPTKVNPVAHYTNFKIADPLPARSAAER